MAGVLPSPERDTYMPKQHFSAQIGPVQARSQSHPSIRNHCQPAAAQTYGVHVTTSVAIPLHPSPVGV